MEYIIDNLTIKKILNNLLKDILLINNINISSYNNYINIKADGVYNNSPSFINLYINLKNKIYIFVESLYVNNINIIKFKSILYKKINISNLKYIDYVNIDKQLIGLSYDSLLQIINKCDLLNNNDKIINYLIKENKNIVYKINNNKIIFYINDNI